MKASLLEFIKTGRLCSIRLGLTKEQIRTIIGPPDELGGVSVKQRQPLIYRYGNIEFHFYSTCPYRCIAIFIERPIQTGQLMFTEKCKFESPDRLFIMSRREVEGYLRLNGILHESNTSALTGVYDIIIRPSGAKITIGEDDRVWSVSIHE